MPKNLPLEKGQKFGRLTFIRHCENISNRSAVYCFCDCGKSKKLTKANLLSGSIKSCGCLASENGTRQAKINISGFINRKTGSMNSRRAFKTHQDVYLNEDL